MSDPHLTYADVAGDISLRDLQAIVSVAETGSFRASASLLHTSQPAISRTVKRVESYFETVIFLRGPRGAELTSAGTEIVHTIDALMAALGQARYKSRTARSTTIRIGAAPTAASVFLAPQIERWISSHPRHHLEIVEEGAETLRELLLSEHCDLALIAGPLEDELSGLYLTTIPVQALFRPDSPRAAHGEPVPVHELARENLLLYTENFISTMLLRTAFNQLALQPTIAYQSANAGALTRLAQSGLGVAVVGKTVDISHTDLVPRPIISADGSTISFDLYAAWLKKNAEATLISFARGIQERSETTLI